MGRQEDRKKIKNLKKGIHKEMTNRYSHMFNSIGSNISYLKSKLVSEDILGDCILKYNGKEYCMTPLVCFLLDIGILDKPGYSYLENYISSVYSDYVVNNNKEMVLSSMVDSFNLVSISTKNSLNSLIYNQLLSLHLLRDGSKSILDAIYNDLDRNAHLNILGINLLLNDKYAIDVEENKRIITNDILTVYNSVNMIVKANKRDDCSDIIFMETCLRYYIESNSVGGTTFDLEEELSSKGSKYIDMLQCIDLDYIDGVTGNDIDRLKSKINSFNCYVMPFYMKSFTNTFIHNMDALKNNTKIEIQDLKKSYSKEKIGYEKTIKLLNRDLKASNKKVSKLEDSLNKANNLNKLTKEEEYKREIEALQLKNKQLESKLEGSNIRINTLTDRVSVLKEQVDTLTKNEDVLNYEPIIPTNEVNSDLVDIDTMVKSLKDLNIVIVGGTDTSYKRISNYLPDVRYIDAETSPNFDIPLNSDYIVLCTKILSHSHTRRAEVFENSVKGIVKVSKTNPIEVIKEIYNTVVC